MSDKINIMRDIMKNEIFKLKLKDTFVKQPCDTSALNVKAAIITSASKMSLCSGIATEEQTISELMELYGLTEEHVGSLIGMNPNYVKSITGYSVDFMDYERATVNYNVNKSNYDELYTEIANRNLNKQTEKQM